jgi:chitinase
VQDRIVGYWEAWNFASTCNGVDFQNLPVGSLTHLNIAFGYITPNTFDITLMPGIPDIVIKELTKFKTVNPNLKIIISLGGWSFSDNGTDTQQVWAQAMSTPSTRSLFMAKLIQFMDYYGLDGVDFDWECKHPLSLPVESGALVLTHQFF